MKMSIYSVQPRYYPVTERVTERVTELVTELVTDLITMTSEGYTGSTTDAREDV